MVMCEAWTKEDFLKKFWNGIRLKEEEREDLEIRGCSK